MRFRGTDRYRVTSRLGAGSYGEVYQARDNQRGDEIAVKVLKRLDADALYRFKREFRALADLRHPNLVSLYELVAEGDQWFFTMELVQGSDLVSHLRGGDGQALRAAFHQLVLGIQALHAASKLHRDIKPANVLVTRRGQVKLLDFGLVAEAGPGSLSSTDDRIVGTAAYMAPEQATGGKVTEAADWYSVGAMLYQALTGRLPHEGERLQVLLVKQSTDPTPPDAFGDAPSDLSALCMRLLAREPDRRPVGAAILEQLQPGDGEATVTSTDERAGQPVFVGRTGELAALQRAFEACQQGRAVIAHLAGLSGMGKTALARQLLDRLVEQHTDGVLLRGRCYERESVPYKALDSLVDALCHHLRGLDQAEANALLPRDAWALVRLFPVLERVEAVAAAPSPRQPVSDPHELRRRALGALRELLARIADRRPLALFIDDVQWDDADSAAVVEEVFGTLDPPAALLLLSYRSEDAAASKILAALARAGSGPAFSCDVVTVPVEPLPLADARALAGALGGDQSGDALSEAIARESGGQPLFVHQLARHVGDLGGGITLERVVAGRIERLPAAPRRLLDVVAVAGHPVPLSVARGAAGKTNGETIGRSALEALREGNFVRSRGSDVVEVYHDRIREAVTAALSPQEQRDLHLRLAAALAATSAPDPETLTRHYQAAGDHEHTVRYAELAADRAAAAMAFDRAAELYRLALESAEEEASSSLRVKLGDALAHGGRNADAARVFLQAARLTPGEAGVDLQLRAAEQLFRSGRVKEGFDVIRPVFEGVGIRMPGSRRRATVGTASNYTRAKLRQLLGPKRTGLATSSDLRRMEACRVAFYGGFIAHEWAYVGYVCSLMTLLSQRTRNSSFEALGLIPWYSLEADLQQARSVFSRARVMAQQGGDAKIIGLVATMEYGPSMGHGCWREALEAAARGERACRKIQADLWAERALLEFASVTFLYYMGRIDEFARREVQVVKAARDRGDLASELFNRTRFLPFVWLARDEPERALSELVEVEDLWKANQVTTARTYSAWVGAEAQLYRREGAAALACIAALREDLYLRAVTKVGIYGFEHAFIWARCAVAGALAHGNPRLLRKADKRCRRLRKLENVAARAVAPMIEACIAWARGEQERAARLFDGAARACDEVEMPLHAACARRRQGELLGGDAGATLIAAADELMHAQGVANPQRWASMHAPGPEFTEG